MAFFRSFQNFIEMSMTLLIFLQIFQYLVLCCKIFSLISEQLRLVGTHYIAAGKDRFSSCIVSHIYINAISEYVCFKITLCATVYLYMLKEVKIKFSSCQVGYSWRPVSPSLLLRARQGLVARTAGPSAFLSGTWRSEFHSASLSMLFETKPCFVWHLVLKLGF